MLTFLPLFSDLLVLLFILLTHVALSSGSVLTAIIDDTAGDSRPGGTPPVYSGSFSLNSNCDGCTVHPDPASAHDGTWHDSSQFGGLPPVSVTLSFNGIGIDVFCIMANAVPGANTATSLAFTLDGTPQQNPFTHDPDPAKPEYEYGVNVFSISGLSQSDHELLVATNNPSGSLLLFDYAQYSYEVADPTTPNPVTDTVIKTSITQITATATDTQKITTTPITPTTPTTLPNTSFSASSFHSGSPASQSFSTNPSSAISSSSTILGNNSISAPPTASPGNSSDSSSSSLAPPVVASSSKRFNFAAVLAGTLIPIFLIAVVGVLCWCRRRRRANIPDTESVSNNGSVAPLFGSVYGDPNPRHGPGSYLAAGADNTESEYASESWPPSISQFDGNGNSAVTFARGIQMREKCNSDATGGDFTSPSPIEHASDPPFSPPPASEYTFESGPPPMYSEQRPLPLPGVPPIPLPHQV